MALCFTSIHCISSDLALSTASLIFSSLFSGQAFLKAISVSAVAALSFQIPNILTSLIVLTVVKTTISQTIQVLIINVNMSEATATAPAPGKALSSLTVRDQEILIAVLQNLKGGEIQVSLTFSTSPAKQEP